MENPDLVYQEQVTQSRTHLRLGECDSRQAIQARKDHSNRMVPPSKVFKQYAAGGTSLKWTCLPPGSTRTTSLSHQFQILKPGQKRPSVYFGRIWTHMPSHQRPPWASGGEAAGPPVQQTPSDCTRVVLHALVLGPGDHVKSDLTVSALSA